MENDVRLQEGHPVDENLRPIKVGGKATALETAQHGNGARVNGDLEVTGNIKGNVKDVELDLNKINSTDLTIDDSGDISLDADGGEILLKDGGTEFGRFSTALSTSTLKLFESAGSSNDDLFTVAVGASGSTIITTTDAGGTGGDLTMNIDGDITLNSNTGLFISENNGTEFSATNSSYAGMVLGYTALAADATTATYAVTNAFVTISSSHRVTFVAPPSGNVEIFVNIFDDSSGSRPLFFGLSDNATYNALDVTHEHHVATVDETDEKEINHRWAITGLTAGTTYTYYLGAKCTHNSFHVLKWGGDATQEYAPFIMKATALPATIYTV